MWKGGRRAERTGMISRIGRDLGLGTISHEESCLGEERVFGCYWRAIMYKRVGEARRGWHLSPGELGWRQRATRF